MKKGSVFWITGLSGAGKSTLANELQAFLKAKNIESVILDGDQLREIFHKTSITQDHYSRDVRLQLAVQYSKLAHLLSSQGINVIVATISMFNEIYQMNRSLMKNYIEIFMDIPIDVLRKRDPKGIYLKGSSGDLKGIAGVDLLVDTPTDPHLTIDQNLAFGVHSTIEEIYKLWLKRNDN
jgi:cytidine diphosphoramidate kinase